MNISYFVCSNYNYKGIQELPIAMSSPCKTTRWKWYYKHLTYIVKIWKLGSETARENLHLFQMN